MTLHELITGGFLLLKLRRNSSREFMLEALFCGCMLTLKSALVPISEQTRAEPAFRGANQICNLRFGQGGKVVDVQVTIPAMPDLVVAGHVVPRGMTRGSDADVLEERVGFHE